VQPYISFRAVRPGPRTAAVLAHAEGQSGPALVICPYSPNVGQGFWHKLFRQSGDSVLPAGYGKYYDHFGESIVISSISTGSYGLSDRHYQSNHVLSPILAPLHDGAHNILLDWHSEQVVSYPAAVATDR